jgi:hypothetical protein
MSALFGIWAQGDRGLGHHPGSGKGAVAVLGVVCLVFFVQNTAWVLDGWDLVFGFVFAAADRPIDTFMVAHA